MRNEAWFLGRLGGCLLLVFSAAAGQQHRSLHSGGDCGEEPLVEELDEGASQGTHPVLRARTQPLIEQRFSVEVVDGPAHAHGCLVFSFTQTTRFHRTFQATSFVGSPNRFRLFYLDSGRDSGPLAECLVPRSLCGVSVVFQAFVDDPTARGGIAFSNGLLVRFGQSGTSAPREAKEAAIQTLLEIRARLRSGELAAGDTHDASKEIKRAIDEIEESLECRLWSHLESGEVDPERLDTREGKHVFHRERKATQRLFKAIDKGEIEDEGTAELLEVAQALALADRRLAEVAILDAEQGSGDEDRIEDARESFAEGDEHLEEAARQDDLDRKARHLYRAIDHDYRHAWFWAIQALERCHGDD